MPKAKYLWQQTNKQSDESSSAGSSLILSSPVQSPLLESPLVLYSSEGCHLCEQAKQLLAWQNIKAKEVDIAFDEKLFATYGTRIPVLQYAVSECEPECAFTKPTPELDWPFTQQELQNWLNNNGITNNT